MARWRLERGSLSLDKRSYAFGPPEGPYLILRGRCEPSPTTPHQRYPHSEVVLAGLDLEVVVQCTFDPECGVEMWERVPYIGTPAEWYPSSSHDRNTLWNDPEFDALVTPHLINQNTP